MGLCTLVLVELCIAGLGAEAIDDRDRFQEALVAMGAPALEGLARVPEPGPEVRWTRTLVERAVRKRGFRGGEIVDHLGVQLTVRSARVKEGEDLVFEVRVVNLDSKARVVTPIQWIDRILPGAEAASPTSQGLLRIEGDAPQERKGGLWAVGESSPPTAVTVEPGDLLTYTARLSRLSPGTYRARFTYYSKKRGLIEAATGDIASNSVEFEITE